ncbi:MAG: sigma-70 family RNA polymerase sigma factor [Planctomycetota bacterium]
MDAKDEDPTPKEMLATAEILAAARSGDQQAKNQLMRRFEPKLRQFLHRRAPRNKQGVLGTEDLVQEVLGRAWKGLERFEHRGQGSFWGYLRTIARNHLHELRRSREPVARVDLEGSDGGPAGSEADPAEHLMSQEEQERYEQALEELGPLLRNAVQMRLELELTYQEIAAECDFPSPDAARMAVQRAYKELLRRLSRSRQDG